MAKETFSSLIDLFKTSSSTTVSTLVCDVCGNKLSVFRKKKPCVECKRQFCSQCLQRGRDRALRCKNCYVLTMRPPVRSALLDLRVKDLQNYLNQHNVSTRGCLEKEDLVNVLLRYANTPGYPLAGNSGNPPPGNSSHDPPRNFMNVPSGHPRNSTETPSASRSEHVSTVPSSSAPNSVNTSSQDQTTILPTGDSDSSSDTSFEIIQRPSSNENVAYVGSSSSSTSTSVSGASVQGNTSPSAPSAPSPAASSPERSTESESTPDAPSSVQTSDEDVASGLGSMSVHSQLDAAGTEAPAESDTSSAAHQETLEVNSQPSLSQPNSSNNSPSLLRGTMASITSEADFEALSVKQLKDILHRHRVNYHGCCEKAELVERAKRLYRDYCASRAELEKLDIDALCKICMDAPVECVMLECGHMATCTDCGRQLSECPICRQFVVRIVRTFKA